MSTKLRFLAGGLVILGLTTLFPTILKSTSEESRPRLMPGMEDNLEVTKGLVVQKMGRMPLAFTKNEGQWDEQALFKANAGGATMWFTRGGTYYQFTRRIPRPDDLDGGRQMSTSAPGERFDHQPDSIETMVIKTSFIGANPQPEVVGEQLMEYKCNYFIGNDPAEWHTDVPNYQAVCLKEVYSGIDLRYYGNGKQMEYDFVVSPGADPSKIAIQYKGALSLSINSSGELVVATEWGEVIEQRPVVYQLQNGARKSIEGEYLLTGDNTFGFSLGKDYDPALPLVIDPTIEYSSYLGGTADDWCYDIAVAANGNIYMTGRTASQDFPVTPSAFDTSYENPQDVFVSVLDSQGSNLIYSTYIGGSSGESGYGLDLDQDGNAYIVGYTQSPNFPAVNAYQAHQGSEDAFVAKLSSSGDSLIYCTCLGGSDTDTRGRDVAVDEMGFAYLTGITWPGYPTTPGSFETTYNNDGDAFVTKLSVAGNSLVYSTYLGGLYIDHGEAIAVDLSGNAYIAGHTSSVDFPFQHPCDDPEGRSSIFVVKVNPSGTALSYSKCMGGSPGNSFARDIVLAGENHAYVIGNSAAANFPSVNALQDCDGFSDAVVFELNELGDSLIFSTCLGGSGGDDPFALAVDPLGNVYIAGHTTSFDFPLEGDIYSDCIDSPDAFVSIIRATGDSLLFSSYLCGNDHNDLAQGITLDNLGYIYVSGWTQSDDFPVLNAYQPSLAGGADAFIVKLSCLDQDDDGICDIFDNCITAYNPGQEDGDGDSIGDACDDCDCGAVFGDVNCDGAVNPVDVVYMVNFTYKSLDARCYPPFWNCDYELGDVNCDGGVNPVDVVYYVNFAYRAQDAFCYPCAP